MVADKGMTRCPARGATYKEVGPPQEAWDPINREIDRNYATSPGHPIPGSLTPLSLRTKYSVVEQYCKTFTKKNARRQNITLLMTSF